MVIAYHFFVAKLMQSLYCSIFHAYYGINGVFASYVLLNLDL